MTGLDTNQTEAKSWWENRTLVIVWLLFFFPVGLYGLWKGTLFSTKVKGSITAMVAVLFFALGSSGLTDFVYAFVLCPAGVFLLWKDPSISRSTTYRFGGALILILIAFLAAPPAQQTQSVYVPGGSCSAVTQSGSCTYYRDSSCNVIAKQCN